MANLTVKTLPEELQKSTAIEGSQLFADLAEVGMVSSDQGAKDIIQDEKRLTEIETFVAPPVEELPTPEEIAKEKIDEEPKKVEKVEESSTEEAFTLEEVTELGIDKFVRTPEGTFKLTTEGATSLGIKEEGINLDAFGSTGVGGNFTLDVTGNRLRGISDEEMLAAVEEAKRQGLTVSPFSLGIKTDSEGNILAEDLSIIDTKVEALVSDFDSFNIDTDPDFQAQAQGIRDQFARITRQTEQINQSREAALRTIGFRRGTRQFAGTIQLGIEGEELNQANQRLLDIVSQEAAAISAARQAFKNQEFSEFNTKLNALQTIRDNKADELNRYNDALIKVNEKLQEEQDKINADIRDEQIRTGVLFALNEGFTDPLEILTALDSIGIKATPDEVTVFTNLISNSDFISNLSSNLQDFKRLEKNDPELLTSIGAVDKNGVPNYSKYLEVIKTAGQTIENELDELLTPNQLVLFNAPAGSTMRDVLGQVPKTELTGIQKFTEENNLAKEFERLVSQPRKAITQIGIIETSLEEAQKAVAEGRSLNAPSQGILVAFQKLLDPESVVRESEYARSSAGLDVISRLEGIKVKFAQGGAGVPIDELAEFVNLATEFAKGYKDNLLKHANRMKVIAEQRGLNLPSILTQDIIDLIGEGETSQQLQTDYENLGFDESYGQAIELFGIDGIQTIIENEKKKTSFNTAGFSRTDGIELGSRLARVNNNPGNLRFAGQKGASQGEGGFAKFENPESGFQALKDQISLDASRGLTLRQFVFKFAPPSENDSELYLQQMIKATGANESTLLSEIDLETLARAMALKESSTTIA